MPNTSERATFQPTTCGPAKYTGGAPMPTQVVNKATPEEQRKVEQHHEATKAQQRVEYAQAAHQENKEHKKGMMDKAKSAAHLAGAKTAAALSNTQHSMTDRFHKKASDAEQKWFMQCFPELHKTETVIEVYQCLYVDGKAHEHLGKLAITNCGVHFADGNKDKKLSLKESAPYKLIASLHITETTPKRLDVYTTDSRVFHFKNLRSENIEHTSVEETIYEAHNWMDFHWRKASAVPHPAATYHSS
ncbi:hypothetical protein DIPPA_03846 [Diplonema papillatum]|nr:hypothetical protein DIPPA_03868 [Diplonema papillatum]KAJ9470241.1 hypothetical protein DIPPA_03848 [Diplonema papillatum]KAJ9470244.1 hypothetical protein DIPPA_03844 [Diplonema papillatum]KAJ9470245.1 hypothetical protein DIPPA_03846 [Diplonema papillatum]